MLTTVTMATTPKRAHHAREVAEQLAPQCDQLFVYVNGHTKIKGPGTWLMQPDGDLAAAGKFYYIPKAGLHLTVDDDLVYPDDYVTQITAAWLRHKGIVSYHGSRIPGTLKSYFKGRLKYPVLDRVMRDKRVHIAGTGCMAWHPAEVGVSPIWAIHLSPPFMVDIHLARWAERHKIPRTVIAHERGDFRHRAVPFEDTLGGQFHQNDRIHTWYVNRTDWEVLR